MAGTVIGNPTIRNPLSRICAFRTVQTLDPCPEAVFQIVPGWKKKPARWSCELWFRDFEETAMSAERVGMVLTRPG